MARTSTENLSGWIFPACDLCGTTAGTDILRLPHADAPGGGAFIRACRGCGLKRLWPRPGPDIIQRYYAADYEAYLGRRRSRLKQALWDRWRDGASKSPPRSKALRFLDPLFQITGNYLAGLITRGDIFRPARGDTLKAIARA